MDIMNIKYKILFDQSLDLSAQDKKDFRRIVKTVLADDKGWAKYGHHFSVGKKDDFNVYIELASPQKIQSVCVFTGLSCYNDQEDIPHIYIHYDNWNGGSKSGLPIHQYRYYAINHEIGHFLGFNHPNKKDRCAPDGTAYVMNQMSLGAEAIYPCLYESFLP